MRLILTLGLIAGGIYAIKKWQQDVREGEQQASWRAQERERRRREQEAWLQDRPLL